MIPEERFSDRVADYVKYRPDYPNAVFDELRKRGKLRTGADIADLGSGTGIFSRMLLDRGYRVRAVEPNADMRAAAETLLGGTAGFTSIDGKAEKTGLPNDSVDAIACAQAFHWFEQEAAREEFTRILKSKGLVGLVWNARLRSGPFPEAYEALLQEHCPEYPRVDHQRPEISEFKEFFAPGTLHFDTFDHSQDFDLSGLAGRVFSSSYVPPRETAGGLSVAKALRNLFEAFQKSGKVAFRYETQLFTGRMN